MYGRRVSALFSGWHVVLTAHFAGGFQRGGRRHEIRGRARGRFGHSGIFTRHWSGIQASGATCIPNRGKRLSKGQLGSWPESAAS